MEQKIKLFGERNTGTRAMIQMLQGAEGVTLNSGGASDTMGNVEWAKLSAGINLYYRREYRKIYVDALRDNVAHETNPIAAWKHASPRWSADFADQRVSVLFALRNPYSWALSMARKPYHMKAERTGDFGAFISRPWLTERRDNCGIVLGSVLGLWNQKLSAYLDFADHAARHDLPIQFLRFEDFIQDPAAQMTEVLRGFDLPEAQLQPIEQSTKSNGKPLDQLQEFYADEGWKHRLTAPWVESINAQIDPALMERFGYSRLDPQDFPVQLEQDNQRAFSMEMLNLGRKITLQQAQHA
ncbi:hypothetical protein GCM10007939_10960 [Amylibacter marinus]|uniref:Sulfotransferase family protein n=1 Tax=Amylibacter marinus TaxID=1475483 RepID=A0ABQ5VUP5_9RHOB|nr:sulfotransferase domain-containing protein [Amylibacter marinus]GLQ34813.1 hypothetical protein GCM10007939_10960 [Amylibacter marinus]